MRFGPKNRVLVTTTTTGTGPYICGDPYPGRQGFSGLVDGTAVPYWCAYGTQWECGIGTKVGTQLRRTRVLESSNGNGPVDWVAGKKDLGIDWLAQNVVYSSDESITIEDEITTGKTNLRGLKLSDVTTWLSTGLVAGNDIRLAQDPTTKAVTVSHRKTIVTDIVTPAPGTPNPVVLALDLSAGSVHLAKIECHRRLRFLNSTIGQEFLLRMSYDTYDGNDPQVTWPDANKECVITWARGYPPSLDLVPGHSDAFVFVRISDTTIIVNDVPTNVPQFLGWAISTQHRRFLEVTSVADVVGTVSVIHEGVTKGPDEIKWLSATVDRSRMTYTIAKVGTVTGGTFSLTIGATPSTSTTIDDIPFDVTPFALLELVWDATALTELEINSADPQVSVSDGDSLTLEFLGASRYLGWVVSVDSGGLEGGGTYEVTSTDESGGEAVWPFSTVNPDHYAGRSFRLVFGTESTGPIAVNAVASVIQTALESLPNIGAGNIVVRSAVPGVFSYQFVGALRSTHIADDIVFKDAWFPSTTIGAATGQVSGSSRRGVGPQGSNETQRLTITGSPVNGDLVLTILGRAVTLHFDDTANEIQTKIRAALNDQTAVRVTGGPLPITAVDIEYTGPNAYTNVVLASVNTAETGAAVLDWSVCDGATITFAPSTGGEFHVKHVNPIKGKTLNVTLVSDDATGTIEWDGVAVDWGDATPPTVSASPAFFEFYAEDVDDIKGREWFGSGRAGLDTDALIDWLQDHLQPGIGIEISYDSDSDLFVFDRLETIKDDAYSSNITIDLSANVGEHHQITLTGNTTLSLRNEVVGEKFRILITQSGNGGHQVTWWGGITWAPGYVPALTPVPGKSDLFEFLTRAIHGPYTSGNYLGWVESPLRPKFATATETGDTTNEVQRIACNGTPTGGVWTITFDGQSTTSLPHDISASALQSALQSLSTIGAGNVQVSGGRLGMSPFIVTFVGSLGSRNVSRLQTSSSLVF